MELEEKVDLAYNLIRAAEQLLPFIKEHESIYYEYGQCGSSLQIDGTRIDDWSFEECFSGYTSEELNNKSKAFNFIKSNTGNFTQVLPRYQGILSGIYQAVLIKNGTINWAGLGDQEPGDQLLELVRVKFEKEDLSVVVKDAVITPQNTTVRF